VSPRLAILTGTLAGQTRALESRLSLGRDSLSDIRFDPTADAEVSGRHGEVRIENGAAFIRDTNSTNGIYVNGTRVRGEQRLADGDVIRLGAAGPKIRFEADPGSAPRGSTNDRIGLAVRRQTRGLRAALVTCVAIAAAGGWFALSSARHANRARDTELEALRRRNDSLSVAIDRDVHAMTGRLAGLDSALAAAKRESDQLRMELRNAKGAESVAALSTQLANAESRRGAIAAVGRMDYEAVAAAAGKSVVMIAVEMADGKAWSGSGVSVSADGSIVTNAHLVRERDGQSARRIAVVYADTRDWLPAHVERVAADADLAVLRVDRTGTFPFTARVANGAPVVGEPVAILGFPLGAATPMDGSTGGIIARSTLAVGTVSKSLSGVLQVDAFASEGSSGSPVFTADGAIAGIVYGGAPAAAGRIVYAVPAAALKALLR
jgi:S1-C subfamily serine protease